MKGSLRNFFVAVLATVSVLGAGLVLVACNNTYNGTNNTCDGDHNFVLTSTTVTCTESGAELYTCSKCSETKTEEAASLGHNYNKNVCERCGDTLTDLSQFSENDRNEIADKLESIAPHTAEIDTWVSSTRLLELAADKVSECESTVEQAQADYDEALEKANNSHSTADISKVTAAQTALLKAQNELQQANEDLKAQKESYQYDCAGYAWNLAIAGIKESNATSYAVNHSLEFLMSTEMTALNTTTAPTWYNDIVNNIKSLIGIDIKTGA